MSRTLIGFLQLQSFLHKALMPLHKPKCVGLYHQQLAYCVTQVIFTLVHVMCMRFCWDRRVGDVLSSREVLLFTLK